MEMVYEPGDFIVNKTVGHSEKFVLAMDGPKAELVDRTAAQAGSGEDGGMLKAGWDRRFVLGHGKWHPETAGTGEVGSPGQRGQRLSTRSSRVPRARSSSITAL